MSGSYLLDTNIVIAFLGGEVAIKERVGQADEILLSSIVAGELYFGARKSAQAQDNLARIDELIGQVVTLECDAETAKQYGAIKNTLREKGRPIPDNDIWIAAIALQYGLTLASRDVHFAQVEGLKIEAW